MRKHFTMYASGKRDRKYLYHIGIQFTKKNTKILKFADKEELELLRDMAQCLLDNNDRK